MAKKEQKITSTKITDDIVMVQLEVNQLPTFKVDRFKKMIKAGNDNKFFDHLLYLYNNHPIHQAIIDTKASYVFGDGVITENPSANEWLKQANPHESWEMVLDKLIKDKSIFKGYAILVKSNALGKPIQFFHLDFARCRLSEDFTEVLYSDDWTERQPKITSYPFYQKGIQQESIIYYKEYQPSASRIEGAYPLPEYVGALLDIDTDIEISQWCNSYVKNGFSATSMVTIFGGKLRPEEKENLAMRLKESHTGSGNAGKFILVLAEKDAKGAEVAALQAADAYQQFQEIQKRNEQNIISGHQFHSILAGIKTEGQLGGRNEFNTTHDQFILNYAEPNQKCFINELKRLYKDATEQDAEFEFIQKKGLQYDLLDPNVSKYLTNDEVRELLGYNPVVQEESGGGVADKLNVMSPLVATKVLEFMTENEVRNLAGLKPKNFDPNAPEQITHDLPEMSEGVANESIKSLSRRQTNNLIKIVADYNNGKTSKDQAMILLQGFGLSEEEALKFLGIAEEDGIPVRQAIQMKKQKKIQEYLRDHKTVVKDTDIVLEEHPMTMENFQLAFEDEIGQNQLRNGILKQFKGNPFTSFAKLAKMFDTDKGRVQTTVNWLVKHKLLSKGLGWYSVTDKGYDKETGVETVVETRYYYGLSPEYKGQKEIIPTSRDWCVDTIAEYGKGANNRITFEQIDRMRNEFGDNAWDFRGGFYNNGSQTTPWCRHVWVAETVLIKKDF